MKAPKFERQRIARERVNALFEQASLHPRYAKRYVQLARRISSRYKIRIPARWRRRFCKACNAFLVPGKNCRVRIHKSNIVIRCTECESVRRIAKR